MRRLRRHASSVRTLRLFHLQLHRHCACAGSKDTTTIGLRLNMPAQRDPGQSLDDCGRWMLLVVAAAIIAIHTSEESETLASQMAVLLQHLAQMSFQLELLHLAMLDSSFMIMATAMAVMDGLSPPQWWVRPWAAGAWRNMTRGDHGVEDYHCDNIRMGETVFCRITANVEPYLHRQHTWYMAPTPLDKLIAYALYRWATERVSWLTVCGKSVREAQRDVAHVPAHTQTTHHNDHILVFAVPCRVSRCVSFTTSCYVATVVGCAWTGCSLQGMFTAVQMMRMMMKCSHRLRQSSRLGKPVQDIACTMLYVWWLRNMFVNSGTSRIGDRTVLWCRHPAALSRNSQITELQENMKWFSALVVVVSVAFLIALVPFVSGWCRNDTDHDPNTRRRVDCIKIPIAQLQLGCQSLCYREKWCEGIVWVTEPADYVKGKYCCYLKNKYNPNALKPQLFRKFCKRGY
ncbi:hypothetical protein CBR_g8185 [Chara braunii]|uniref:Uncharacterized protein n=1 Tax=Chara braunii TaxID=69332 RepID=A0A388KLG2_CHABU|nr:hypothetical protein CBR_g8185 [Chara braunii]|eukprot:GBG70885.1 hypothetical protein CBR_g8185 [Chara braunii]